MTIFERLRGLIRPDVDRTYAADLKPIMDFSSVDHEKIKTDLTLEARGSVRGAANEPSSDAAALDEIELEIVNTVSKLKNEAYEDFSKQVSAYDGRLARLDLRTIVPEIKTMLNDADADFSAEVRKDNNHVHAKKREFVAVQEAYEGFRKEYGIRRLAEPEKSPILAIAILGAIFIAETVANSGFFSATHPGGLFGAVFEAAAISAINLATGFVLGILPLRYLQKPSFLWKLSMLPVALALICLALGFNLFAAHYRDAFASISPEAENFIPQASALAFEKMTTSLYKLAGFQSYLMVLVGLLIVFYATFKGFTWLDPFPGYGAVYKRYLSRLREYLSMIDDLIRSLQDRKDRAVQELRESISDIRRRDEEYGVVVSERARLVQRYNGYVEALQRASDLLFQTYRTANKDKRTTPPPKTFASGWQAGWTPERDVGDDTKAERKEAVTELLGSIADAQTRLLAVFQEALKEYDKLRDFDQGVA